MWKRGRVCAAVEMSLSIVLGHLRFNDAVFRFRDAKLSTRSPAVQAGPRPKKPTDSALGKVGIYKRRNLKKQYERELAAYKRQLKQVTAARARFKQGKPIGDEFRCCKQFISDQRNKLLYSG